jgi:hypothetical protein
VRLWLRIGLWVLAFGGAVSAAILVNLALLGYAQPSNDPVGKLRPRVVLSPNSATSPAPAPAPPPGDDRGGDHDD